MNFKPVKRSIFLAIAFSLITASSFAQIKNYSIDIKTVEKIVPQNLPQLGGNGKSGNIAVNNYFISKDGKPIIPITGEFHFSRYPNQYWDESIKKMKAGGINMIATYVFWNIHEEKEGVFTWTGDRDLRKFIELCAKNDIMVIVRVGPFDHGEIRNGGLPDWLLGKPLNIRSNDPAYLHYVELLYNQIGHELKGLYYKNGGPIVAVQLENEMQHSAAPWGLTYPGQPYDFTVADQDQATAHEGVSVADRRNQNAESGNQHMKNLKALALKAGMNVPLFTATGWGYGAVIPNETIPVTAAYAYPTWVPKKELSPFYLYKDLHHTPDYSPVRYGPMDYPAFAAELGSGIMSTYTRRPTVPAESIDALINRCLGGGANGIGYYMYHGGSTPVGEHYFFSDETYGYPKISYDFQAPIGEYGRVKPSFNRLKLIHFFLNDFAAELTSDITVLPNNALELKPDNLDDLRYAVRTDGNSGFVFINNFQDNIANRNQRNFRITINLKKRPIAIPEQGSMDLAAGENLILPFNFNINQSILIYSTAQLMAKSDDAANRFYIFFNSPGNKAEFAFLKSSASIQSLSNTEITKFGNKIFVKCLTDEPAEFLLTSASGIKTKILVVSKAMALKASAVQISGTRHFLFTDALVLPDGEAAALTMIGHNTYEVQVFPKIASSPIVKKGEISSMGTDKIFSNFKIQLKQLDMEPEIVKTGLRKLSVSLPAQLPDGVNDIFMTVDYVGDTAMGFLGGELIADDFYKGVPWEIGLKRFIGKQDRNLGFYFRPMMKDAPFLFDLPEKIAAEAKKNNQTLNIMGIKFTPEYKTIINF